MKKQIVLYTLVILMMSITGCQVVGGIFKAGMLWAFILMALVIGGIIYLISRGRNK
jgi:predicted phage tail protein